MIAAARVRSERFAPSNADAIQIAAKVDWNVETLYLDMCNLMELSDEVLAALRYLADVLDKRHVRFVLLCRTSEHDLQVDVHRLHRRMEVERFDPHEIDAPPERGGLSQDVFDMVTEWRVHAQRVSALISDAGIEAGYELMRWIVENEDRLYAQNRVKPYCDVVPKLVENLPAQTMANLLELAPADAAARVLVGDYTRIRDETIAAVLACMDESRAGSVIDCIAADADGPARLTPVLLCLDDEPLESLCLAGRGESILAAVDAAESLHEVKNLIGRFTYDVVQHAMASATARTWRRDAWHAYLSPECRERLSWSPISTLAVSDPRATQCNSSQLSDDFATASGHRFVRPYGKARHIHVDEWLDSPSGRKRVVVDVLEFAPEDIRIECMLGARNRLTIEQCDDLFSDIGDGRPTEEMFRETGMVRVSEEVAASGAIAGINGNFYFDYGHYEIAPKIHVDIHKSIGLKFGDPIGWFVSGGKELSPAALNRCALIATDDGEFHIRRVMMEKVEFHDMDVRWDETNTPGTSDQCILFTPLFGPQTASVRGRVDLSVADGAIVDIRDGGGSNIPLTGFTLSIPESRLTQEPSEYFGAEVSIETNFKHKSPIVEAIGAGPMLVSGGQPNIDFRVEDFGRKDSCVMSFFLPRLVRSYEAARSFVMKLENGNLGFGVVSGRAFGRGDLDQPAGLTFGELAILARDLGAVDAMGLDGGGSSSLVTRADESIEVLNVPTGGSDVPRGQERFISTLILIHDKQSK